MSQSSPVQQHEPTVGDLPETIGSRIWFLEATVRVAIRDYRVMITSGNESCKAEIIKSLEKIKKYLGYVDGSKVFWQNIATGIIQKFDDELGTTANFTIGNMRTYDNYQKYMIAVVDQLITKLSLSGNANDPKVSEEPLN
jgi:hypothetical protein